MLVWRSVTRSVLIGLFIPSCSFLRQSASSPEREATSGELSTEAGPSIHVSGSEGAGDGGFHAFLRSAARLPDLPLLPLSRFAMFRFPPPQFILTQDAKKKYILTSSLHLHWSCHMISPLHSSLFHPSTGMCSPTVGRDGCS